MEPSQPIECDSKPLDVHSPSNDDHLGADPDDWGPSGGIGGPEWHFCRRSGPVRAHRSCRRRPEGTGCHRSCRGWRRSEPVDTAQDVGEQVTRNDNLGHLERDVAPVAHDLRFRNGAFPVKLLLSIDRGRDTILRSRSSGAWGAFRNGAFPVKLLLSIDRGRDTILRSRSSGAWGAFRNGAFPVKLLLSIDRGRDTILRSRSSGAWGAFVLPVSFATNSLTSLCRSPGSCFRPWSARRLP